MDWHVSRNQNVSKIRKQKYHNQCLENSLWVPRNGLVENKCQHLRLFLIFSLWKQLWIKKSEEVAVPTNEKHSVCVLCGELFDYLYGNETNGWMYKGEVYMQAPSGRNEGIYRSKLGPIIHAKCESESMGASFADFEEDEQVRSFKGHLIFIFISFFLFIVCDVYYNMYSKYINNSMQICYKYIPGNGITKILPLKV